jgi:hypothetical protein
MVFVVTKVSDRGSSDPIVARTMLQTYDLCDLFLDGERKNVVSLIAHDVQRRLSACDTIRVELSTQIDAALANAREKGLPVQANGQVVEIPAIEGLDDKVESYLYNAKLCLRDIARLFKPLFGKHFEEKFNTFAEWVNSTYGDGDPLSKMLADDRPWIARLVAMRNGVEHPEHRAGPLKIRNFFLDQSSSPPTLSTPVWWQGNVAPTEIAIDMRAYCHNLLTFFEELLVLSLLKVNSHPFASIAEIPEAERDPRAPKRFRTVLTIPLPSPEPNT